MKNICTCDQHQDYVGCCETIFNALNDCKYGLQYRKDDRTHSWRSPNNKMSHGIAYCPWCGTKLPPHLVREREEILLNEFGISNEFDKKQAKKIPVEFLTDEWWKKRGL